MSNKCVAIEFIISERAKVIIERELKFILQSKMKPSLNFKTPSETSSNNFRINQTLTSIIPIIDNNINKESKSSISKAKKLEKASIQTDTKITTYFSSKKDSKLNQSKEKEMNNNQSIKQFDLSIETKAFLTNEVMHHYARQKPKIQMSLLESFSIREKYQNLLIRRLILPVEYNQLLNRFIELDKILLSNKTKLRRTIQRVATSKEEIMKMLFVMPNCFYIYSLTNNNNALSIVIESNIKSNLMNHLSLKKKREKRQQAFRNKLLQLVNNEHQIFLRKNNIINFNPFKFNTWHSDFNIEQCPEIPILSHYLLS